MKKLLLCLFSFLMSLNVFAETKLTRNEEINLLNRIGYGSTSEDLEHLEKIGYENWLKEQLTVSKKEKLEDINILFNKYKENDFYYNQSFLQKGLKEEKSFNLVVSQLNKRINNSIFSKNRIEEMMLWFWFNHFNVGVKTNTIPVIFLDDYETRLKNNGLGNFKDLLKNVSSSPAMLTYLNNVDNTYNLEEKNLNENYAREFLELHTMGVNSGYTQNDVEEFTKILTGHTRFRFEIGNSSIKGYEDFVEQYKDFCGENYVYKDFYVFCGNYHFNGDKNFLNHIIKNNNEKELDEVIDILVSHEATANFISKKLYIYFVSDEPNDKVIKKMAKKFHETKGSINEVLKVLFLSDEFINSLKKPEKIKDTYTYIISILKTEFNHEFLKKTPEIINDVGNFLFLTSGTPYDRNTPDGLSIIGKDWLSSARFQEYIYFNESLFSKFLEPSRNEINYDLISEIKGEKVEIRKQVIEFNLSQKWIKR